MKLPAFARSGWGRVILLALYYAAILAGVILLQALLPTPPFIYTGF